MGESLQTGGEHQDEEDDDPEIKFSSDLSPGGTTVATEETYQGQQQYNSDTNHKEKKVSISTSFLTLSACMHTDDLIIY